MTSRIVAGGRRGRPAPAALALLALAVGVPHALWAQAPRPAQTQAQAQAQALPVPDRPTQLKLLWGTMAAVDHANRTGNYSVLRDLGSTGFQTTNNPATLAAAFADLRAQAVDISDTLVVSPTYEIEPTMIAPDMLRMRGRFKLRPRAIGFDLIFQWSKGWRLHGIAVQPLAP